VNLSDVTSVAEAVGRVRDGIARLKPGEWLQGDGWDEGKLAERRYLLAADLDAVSPNNPVWLETHHRSLWCCEHGSVAAREDLIEHAESERGYDRPRRKRRTQRRTQGGCSDLVGNLIPPPTPDQRRAGILKSIELLHREGMTAVKDPSIERPTWDAYAELLNEGKLNERICVLWYAGTTLDSARNALREIQAQPLPPQSLGDGRLLSCGAKIYMDGSGGARTAWLYKDWNKNSTDVDAGNSGLPSR